MSSIGPDFPRLLQDFFLQRLIAQRGVSRQTIMSYRDAIELLLRFAEGHTGRPPSSFKLEDFDAPLVLDFLDHLEQERGNSPRTRNARLTAIRSFMRYAGSRDPAAMPVVQRILAIPAKRFDRPILGYLSREEMQAILQTPDCTTWSGHRDSVLLATLYNSGARVSEITSLRVANILFDRQPSLHIHGKGRKERVVPLWKGTAVQLQNWIDRIKGRSGDPVFPNRFGQALSRSGVRQRIQHTVALASEHLASLSGRRISPHTFRHTTAMHLLQSGVDLTVIALLLGHEDVSTTHRYLEADLAMKEAALQRLQEPESVGQRFRASKGLLAFLDSL